jgi:hypothetical protein
MLLGVKPLVFLVKLLVFFALTYLLWEPFAPVYTRVLAVLTQVGVSASELVGSAATRGATTVFARGEGIFFAHKMFPGAQPPGIPADWVQANMVLLIPLMLATPAPSMKVRIIRLVLALAAALLLQVVGLVITIKSTWASQLGHFSALHYGWLQRKAYNFLDAFFQAFDTQLFPFVIWAGIHFRQLLALRPRRPVAASEGPRKSTAPRAERRRQARRA